MKLTLLTRVCVVFMLWVQKSDTFTDKQLGCFIDKKDNRDLFAHYYRDERMTPEKCVNKCGYLKFKYAGVQARYMNFNFLVDIFFY